MLLKIKQATKIYNTQVVLDNIDFEVNENETIGIVGRNGCGKSTLLKIIAEKIHLDHGEIIKNRNVSIGYLHQEVFSDTSKTVQETMEEVFNYLILLQNQIRELEKNLDNPNILDEYSRKVNLFENQGGYTYKSEIEMLLTKFGFSKEDFSKKIKTFSGGQKTKLALIKLLLEKPDILLLDEPTNHLDLKTITWLEGYLKSFKKSIVIVSHDRMFLNEVCKVICEVEYGKIYRYYGSYDKFLEEKKKRKERQHQQFVKQQEEIERLEQLIEKFRFKKSKASFVKSKIKYIERMDKVEDARNDERVFKAKFISRIRSGQVVLECENLTIGYNTPLAIIQGIIYRNSRIAILGDNGVGKTTFLKTLMDEVKPINGDFLFGHHVEIGHYDQEFNQLSDENTILEEVWSSFPNLNQYEIRTALGTFLFTQEEVFKKVGVLSLGEKARIALLKLMLFQPNVLLLDEPTNHLDIPTKEALENALLEYDGTILFVSHDRYFIKKMANKVLTLDLNGSVCVDIEKFEEKETIKQQEIKKEKSIQKSKEIKKVENKIEKLEEKLKQCKQQRFEEEIYLDIEKSKQLEKLIIELESELEELMMNWEALNEL